MKPHIYYIANARLPTEKAHGIQIAKMCEAFIEAGASLTIVAPKRHPMVGTMQAFYHLRVAVPVVYVPGLDLYTKGRVGYRISTYVFMVTTLLFLWGKKLSREKCVVYTVDFDDFSSSWLPLSGLPLYTEMHGAKPRTLAQRALFRYARGVFAINNIIAQELQILFPMSKARYLVEPNGVDLAMFTTHLKHDARAKLGLPLEAKIVVYCGRFFAWKGLEVIPKAAKITPDVFWYMVGGEEKDFVQLVEGSLPSNLFFAGSRPHTEMPFWFSAADALLVLGTIRDTQSYKYTSPMKLFEYMTARRAIVAAGTPAICEIVSEKEVLLYEPDNSESLAAQVETAVTTPELERSHASMQLVRSHTWSARAERIFTCIIESYE